MSFHWLQVGFHINFKFSLFKNVFQYGMQIPERKDTMMGIKSEEGLNITFTTKNYSVMSYR